MGGILGVFSDRVWDVVVAAPTAGLAFALIFRFPQIMERWNERRRIRAEERASDWSRLRDEIERQAASKHAVEAENAALKAELADARREIEQTNDAKFYWQEKATVAEAKLLGRSEVRQEWARNDAARRMAEKRQAEGNGDG